MSTYVYHLKYPDNNNITHVTVILIIPTIPARKVVAVRNQLLTFVAISNEVYGADLHKERRFLCALSFATGKSICI